MTEFTLADWLLVIAIILATFFVVVLGLINIMDYLERKRLLAVRLAHMGGEKNAVKAEDIPGTTLFVHRQHNLVERKIAQYLAHFQSENQIQIFLYQAGLQLKLTQLFLIFMGLVILITFILLKMQLTIPIIFGGGIFGAIILLAVSLKFLKMRRQSKFEKMFPTALDILVRSIKSGHSLEKALRIVAHEVSDPVGNEFTRILQQIEVGQSFEQALRDASMRVGMRDFTFLADALIIQHETGGRLEDILENIIDVQRRRREIRQKIGTATAEVRSTATILASIPIVLAAIFVFVRPTYMRFFIDTPEGRKQFLIAGILLATEFIFAKWLTNVDMDS